MRNISTPLTSLVGVLALFSAATAYSSTPCDEPGIVGGGQTGVSPGFIGPPNSLGWDVGGGQCNGSFAITSDPKFHASGKLADKGIELALLAEQRGVGQVANNNGDYLVQTGSDPNKATRAWWNWQASIANHGGLDDLDALCLDIRTDAGSAVPAGSTDLLNIRSAIDDRNGQPNGTTDWEDLYQISQNPVFGWLTNGAGAPYNRSEPGAWRITLSAWEKSKGKSASVSICVHTPGQVCQPEGKRPKKATC